MFFWGNGMQPDMASYWITWHGNTDKSGLRSMADLVRHAKNNDGFLGKYPYFDMVLGYKRKFDLFGNEIFD